MKKLNKNKIIVCSIFLLIFIFVAIVVLIDKNRIIDKSIYNFIMSFRCSFLDKYFIFITHFGDTVFIVGFVSGFILLSRNIYGVLMGVSAMDSALMTFILKHIFVRNRPNHLRLIKQGGYSFPSGHSMISVCVYGYLLYLVLKIKNKLLKYILASLLIFLIISIGISRIYVGVHYPTDVLAGYSLGIIEVILLTEVLRLYKNRGN